MGQLLASMTTLVPEDAQLPWKQAINKIVSMETSQADGGDVRPAKDEIVEILGQLQCNSSIRTRQDKSSLPDDVIEVAVHCIGSVSRCSVDLRAVGAQAMDGADTAVAMEIGAHGDGSLDAECDNVYRSIQDLMSKTGRLYTMFINICDAIKQSEENKSSFKFYCMNHF